MEGRYTYGLTNTEIAGPVLARKWKTVLVTVGYIF